MAEGRWKPYWTISAIVAIIVLLVTTVTSAVTFANGVSADRQAAAEKDAEFAVVLGKASTATNKLTDAVNALTTEMARREYIEAEVSDLKERVRSLERNR